MKPKITLASFLRIRLDLILKNFQLFFFNLNLVHIFSAEMQKFLRNFSLHKSQSCCLIKVSMHLFYVIKLRLAAAARFSTPPA